MTTWNLVIQSFQDGGRLTRRRLGLVPLIYGVNLIVALFIALPVYRSIIEHVGITGFGPDLIESFDFLLWREIVADLSDVLVGMLWQLLLAVPIYWIWKTAVHVGVIYALHQGAIWPFWRGVGYYTGRGFLIGLMFGPLKAIWLLISVVVAGTVRSFFPGEIGIFWSVAVLLPFLILSGLAVIDLFQRYARMALIVRHDTIGRAFYAGLSWPFKYGAASYLYIAWYLVALCVTLATFAINAKVNVGATAIFVGFLVQQISLVTRAGVTVAWIGSETSLFERTHISELPLIADLRTADAGEELGDESMA